MLEVYWPSPPSGRVALRLVTLFLCTLAMATGQTAESPSRPVRGDYAVRKEVAVGSGQILVEAPATARLAAVRVTASKMSDMLRRLPRDTADRLGEAGLVVVLVPISARFTDTPEVRDLAGKANPFGQPLDQARGLFRQIEPPAEPRSPAPADLPRRIPLIVIGEEKVLRLAPDSGRSGIHHELAHAIYRLALTDDMRTQWSDLYKDSQLRGRFAHTYAMVSPEEYFAELTEAFFDVAPYFCSREQLARVDPSAFRALRRIYEALDLPPP
jgi:hypothetical protein